ncbi:MAG: winged helix-turn-helix transcriptional regulator, partial [Bacteroidales bacterium]|nr:winged helix-turn-helix transcriptional regulator [Bacteroidales bacterium]
VMKEAGLPEPKFGTQGFFTVTFMKRAKGTPTNNDRLNDRLNSREKRVLQVLSETPGLRTNELSSLVEVSIPTLSRTMKNLINLGLIEYRGAKKTGGYFIVSFADKNE